MVARGAGEVDLFTALDLAELVVGKLDGKLPRLALEKEGEDATRAISFMMPILSNHKDFNRFRTYANKDAQATLLWDKRFA